MLSCPPLLISRRSKLSNAEWEDAITFFGGGWGGVISNFPCTMYSTCHSQQAQSTFWRIKMLLNDWLTHMGRMGRFPEMFLPHLKSWNLILSKFFQCKICIRCLQTRDWDFALFENWEVQRRQKGFEFLIEMLNFLWRDWIKKLWIAIDLWHWKWLQKNNNFIFLCKLDWGGLFSFLWRLWWFGYPIQWKVGLLKEMATGTCRS